MKDIVIRFHKMHGLGNDYVYVDGFENERVLAELDEGQLAEMARRAANRNFGIGSDGLILILPSERADCRMRMFNGDGSESEMCGNGVRCVAKYAYESGIAPKNEMTVETGAGVLTLQLAVEGSEVQRVRVNMGMPRLSADQIPVELDPAITLQRPKTLSLPTEIVMAYPLEALDRRFEITCVSMGNPHCVIFVDDVANFPVEKYGPAIETHAIFPKRANVEFVTVVDRQHMIQRTWERGAGETLACGTGASAVCAAGMLNALTDRKVSVRLLGGELELEWTKGGEVYMTGPATHVFSGTWRVSL